AHLRARADDAVLVEVAQLRLGYVGDVVGGLLGPQLGVAHVADELLYMYGAEFGVLDEALGNDDGVLVVGARPAHERHERVLAQSELALVGGGDVGQELALLDMLAYGDRR